MTSLASHQSAETTKLLLIGDSGSGKTGALASLVKAGYKLRILDFDNGLDILAKICQKQCPDKIGNVEFRTLRDKLKSSDAGPVIDGLPRAFTAATKMMDKWAYEEDSKKVDLGPPSAWDKETILVLDSLTLFSGAAFRWAEMMQASSKNQDRRQIYFAAQQAIESTLAYLTAREFKANVIITAHIRYSNEADGSLKGFPNAVGSALGPTIPAYFNSMALVSKTGSGDSLKRVIKTTSTPMLDLKNPAPFTMAKELPIETGLADFFKTVRG